MKRHHDSIEVVTTDDITPRKPNDINSPRLEQSPAGVKAIPRTAKSGTAALAAFFLVGSVTEL
jgi:hypothetical protein